MVWTSFKDMNSGGGQKEAFNVLYIEAPEAEAKMIFYNRFGHSPDRVTCTCCGGDYSIDEHTSLEQATAYTRGCRFDDATGGYVEEPSERKFSWSPDYMTLADFITSKGTPPTGSFFDTKAEFIFAKDIKPEERVGIVPEQGYVWRG